MLFELLLVCVQDTSDRDQEKWFELLGYGQSRETVVWSAVLFAVHGTQQLDVRTSRD